MKKIITFIFFGLILSQSITFSLESKYGDGTNIDDLTQISSDYDYFENLLDMNISYNNLFFYTQLEYSDRPVYGYSRTVARDIPNTYVLEYSPYPFTFKYGHIQTLYGYGLTLNMFQDQATDFDNRIKGIEFKYILNDAMEFFYVKGSGEFGTKSRGSNRVNNLLFDHDLDAYGAQLYTQFGDINVFYAEKKTEYKAGILNDFTINQPFLSADTRLSTDLQSFQINDLIQFNALANTATDVELTSINLGYGNTLGIFDIYYEKSINRYNKILRENEFEDGYYEYFSLSSSIFGIDFLYDFKDYNMLYYMPSSSNPPLACMETTSILASRKGHTINFSDEIGQQLEGRFTFSDIDFLINLSMGMKHHGIEYQYFDFDTFEIIEGVYSKISWSDVMAMDFLYKDFVYHKPFRNIYAEASGWSSNDKFYYKFGYASKYSYDNQSGKNYQSFTIPTQFVYGFENNSSLTLYYEYQNLDNLAIENSNNWDSYYVSKQYDNHYLSLSYHISKVGGLTYYYDYESVDEFVPDFSNNTIEFQGNKVNKWTGIELSLELSSSIQLSIFHGSQKGGMACANGICSVQPSFQDGTKVTLRALF